MQTIDWAVVHYCTLLDKQAKGFILTKIPFAIIKDCSSMKGQRNRSPLDLKFMEVKFLKLDEGPSQRLPAKSRTLAKLLPYHPSQPHELLNCD